MSVMILDKESNKHVMVSNGETNNRNPPSFSAAGNSQDPLAFLEEFEKTAKWNNWCTDCRKKEVFLLCLSGQAERWATSQYLENKEKFDDLNFLDSIVNEVPVKGLISIFKEKYITEEWYDLYTKQYEDRRQGADESPMEYLEYKRYLFRRAGEECSERTEKQQVRDIMKGLVPKVFKFCNHKVKDPFHQEARKALVTLDGVEKLLQSAEKCLFEERRVSFGPETNKSASPLIEAAAVSVISRRGPQGERGDTGYKNM